MSSTNEVKRESEGKLSEANANEKYLYSRVLELEKRNQKLEKKMKKLKKLKKELKEEVAKLRLTSPVQHIAHDHDASTSDVEIVEELNFGPKQSNLDEEQAVNTFEPVNSDINSNNADEEAAFQSNGAVHVEENRGSTIEEAAEEMRVDNSEDLNEEAVDSLSGTASSEVPRRTRNKEKDSKGRRESLLARFSSRNKALKIFGQGSGKPQLVRVQKPQNNWRPPMYLYKIPDLGLEQALKKSLKEY